MAQKSKKTLTDADLEIWQRVSRTVRPYQPQAVQRRQASKPAPKPIKTQSRKAPSSKPLSSKPSWPKPAPALRRTPDGPPEVMADKRTRRGKIQIDRKIDLHDMTQDQALSHLERAVLSAKAKNYRCLLVITGKGGVHYKGVLRRMLPLWLASPNLRPHIARYASAHQRHGGQGAFYVFLKG